MKFYFDPLITYSDLDQTAKFKVLTTTAYVEEAPSGGTEVNYIDYTVPAAYFSGNFIVQIHTEPDQPQSYAIDDYVASSLLFVYRDSIKIFSSGIRRNYTPNKNSNMSSTVLNYIETEPQNSHNYKVSIGSLSGWGGAYKKINYTLRLLIFGV